MSRIATEGKGIISLFSVFQSFFYDIMIFDFKFGSNRTAGSVDMVISFLICSRYKWAHATRS